MDSSQKKPRVQVLLSTYNGEKFLAQQLDSICGQTYRPLEILVRDDGSTDGTPYILAEYADKGLLTYSLGSNLGVVGSFLTLCRQADVSCDYFAFSDQDDYWESEKIERAVTLLAQGDASLPLVYGSQIKIVDENLTLLRERHDKKVKHTSFGNAMLENVITGCTAVFNGHMRQALAGLSQTEDFFMHDWLVYLIASSMGQVIYDQNAYLLYRQHDRNVLGASTGSVERLKHKLGQLQRYIRTDLVYTNNAAFYKAFEEVLPADRKKLLAFYLKKDKSFYERLTLALFSGLYRQRWFDSLIFKLLLILGLM